MSVMWRIYMAMGEFNSDDHYIYYYGQKAHRKNGVGLITNKRVRNAVFGFKSELGALNKARKATSWSLLSQILEWSLRDTHTGYIK